ncbi:MAG: hypothetical protein EBX63_01985, partial [Betaproteobacteria bacterium]|nr:hypothetical protein [Betaproteobacteria bacterium]
MTSAVELKRIDASAGDQALGASDPGASVQNTAARRDAALAIRVVVNPSTRAKCERCWHYHPSVGSIAAHPGLCSRCDENLHGPGEIRRFA